MGDLYQAVCVDVSAEGGLWEKTAVRWPIQSESCNYQEPLRKSGFIFFLPFIFLLCILAVFTQMPLL